MHFTAQWLQTWTDWEQVILMDRLDYVERYKIRVLRALWRRTTQGSLPYDFWFLLSAEEGNASLVTSNWQYQLSHRLINGKRKLYQMNATKTLQWYKQGEYREEALNMFNLYCAVLWPCRKCIACILFNSVQERLLKAISHFMRG